MPQARARLDLIRKRERLAKMANRLLSQSPDLTPWLTTPLQCKYPRIDSVYSFILGTTAQLYLLELR